MDLLFAVAGAVLVSVGVAWSRTRRAPLPAWTDYEETQISPGLWNIEGRIDGHVVRAAVVRGLERAECNMRIETSGLLDPSWTFNANLRTGKVWSHVDGKLVTIFPGAHPAIRDDLHLCVHGGTAEVALRSRGDAHEIHQAATDVLALLVRVAAAVRPDALVATFHTAEVLFEQEKILALLAVMHPHHACTRELLELCAASEEPVLELAAARHLEGERQSALLRRLIEVDHAYDSVRAEALIRLQPFLDAADAQEIALKILAGSPSLSRRAAIRLLADFPPAEAPERLLEIAQHVQHGGTAIDLVRTLSSIGGERAVHGLEHLLGFEGAQRETLAALARLGDRRTLGVIHDHLELLEVMGLRDATAEAIRQIRERLGAPDGGRLSVVEAAPVGGVSVIDGVGELGLSDE